jgi:hypothetical protein
LVRSANDAGVPGKSTPIRGILVVCCGDLRSATLLLSQQ